MRISQKNVVVVGGGSGMGLGTAQMMAERGASVAILSYERDVEQIAAALAEATGGTVRGFQLDMADRAAVAEVFQAAAASLGGIDVCISTAGIIDSAEINEPGFLPLVDQMVTVNLIGTLNVVDASVRIMRENEPDDDGERGVVVLTGSMAALEGVPGQAPYCAAKAGLIGAILPIARELAGAGIRINAIEPGGFETPLTARVPDDFKARVAQTIPNPQRLGVPEDYAVFACALVEARYANAGVYRLDGGWRQTFPLD